MERQVTPESDADVPSISVAHARRSALPFSNKRARESLDETMDSQAESTQVASQGPSQTPQALRTISVNSNSSPMTQDSQISGSPKTVVRGARGGRRTEMETKLSASPRHQVATPVSAPMLLAADHSTPKGSSEIASPPTPATALTQRTQEAILSQVLLESQSSGIATASNDEVTPLAVQLERVHHPMTVGRNAVANNDYAPPSPNVDLFSNFGFTPLQSQHDMPQLRRGGQRSQDISARDAVRSASSLEGGSPQPRQQPGTIKGSTRSVDEPASQLDLSPMTNTQRERREGDRWCMMAKNFFDFIDSKPLITAVAPKDEEPKAKSRSRQ